MTLLFPLMQDVQLGVAAGCEAANDARDLPGILDRLTVYRGNDVTRFNSTLGGGSVFLALCHQRALGLLQTQAVRDILRYRLNLNPDPAAANGSFVLELSDHDLSQSRPGSKRQYRRCRRRENRSRYYANDLTLHIKGGASRVALVNGRVDLNEIVVGTTSDITAAG